MGDAWAVGCRGPGTLIGVGLRGLEECRLGIETCSWVGSSCVRERGECIGSGLIILSFHTRGGFVGTLGGRTIEDSDDVGIGLS